MCPACFTADPRVVAAAHRMATISFDEMLEMCACGCPKPAMRAVEYARTHDVTLHVRSSFTWEPGTWVTKEDPDMEQAIITAVVPDASEAKVTIAGVPDQPGIAAQVFRRLADLDVNVGHDRAERVRERDHRHLVHAAPTAISTPPWPSWPGWRPTWGPAASPPSRASGRVSVVGAGMKSNPGRRRHGVRDPRRGSA